jgi:hypothetical protein
VGSRQSRSDQTANSHAKLLCAIDNLLDCLRSKSVVIDNTVRRKRVFANLKLGLNQQNELGSLGDLSHRWQDQRQRDERNVRHYQVEEFFIYF